jgi:hypothetical protein
VANEFSTSIDQICLIYSGKILKDDEDLKKHGIIKVFYWFQVTFFLFLIAIKDGVTIHLVIRAPKTDTSTNSTSSGIQAEVYFIFHQNL